MHIPGYTCRSFQMFVFNKFHLQILIWLILIHIVHSCIIVMITFIPVLNVCVPITCDQNISCWDFAFLRVLYIQHVIFCRDKIIPVLSDILSESVKEKVSRIILATFRVGKILIYQRFLSAFSWYHSKSYVNDCI